MSLFRSALAFLIILFGVALEAGLQRGGGRTTLFEGARLIVGDGSAPIENASFLVDGTHSSGSARRGNGSRLRERPASISQGRR
ncbi:MAG TPA: hypothetical protein VGF24_29800 [Vicinamibacterales bacterium]|jgi:hypothetical protein